MENTAMQELIEDLKRLSPETSPRDNDVNKAYHEGLQWVIYKAKQKLEKEKQQIIDAWDDAYPGDSLRGGEKYFTQTYKPNK